MNLKDAQNKICTLKNLFLEMQTICKMDIAMFEDNNENTSIYSGDEKMSEIDPKNNLALQEIWIKVQENVPPGFSIDGNLLRHLSFNHSRDWFDISNHDIARELNKVNEYLTRLSLIGYVETLHQGVSRVSNIILDGDYDAALKVVYTGLDSRIRSLLKVKGAESTVPQIGRAFKERVLEPPSLENLEGMRNFLMGVIGYYRHVIAHNELGSNRNSLESSLSLFAVAHEAFKMVEYCGRNIKE